MHRRRSEAARYITADEVKARAKVLGADLVGIASAQTLNAFPPDPLWPQTPERISPRVKSVITIVQHIPAREPSAAVPTRRSSTSTCWCCGKWTRVAYQIAGELLEAAGHPTLCGNLAQETEWTYKRASYGRLSTRHLGVESGLGTLGLEVNILTPEYGPRIYLTGVLTELELAADAPMTEQVCIGRILQPLPSFMSGQCGYCISASTSAPAPSTRKSSVSRPS